MPRLRNIQTGAVVSCSHETAANLGSEWVSVAGAVKQVASKPAAPESEDIANDNSEGPSSTVEPIKPKTKK